jgi:hypothetical protein
MPTLPGVAVIAKPQPIMALFLLVTDQGGPHFPIEGMLRIGRCAHMTSCCFATPAILAGATRELCMVSPVFPAAGLLRPCPVALKVWPHFLNDLQSKLVKGFPVPPKYNVSVALLFL